MGAHSELWSGRIGESLGFHGGATLWLDEKWSATLVAYGVIIPWLGYTCGECEYCRGGRENLCPNARFTGYQFDGGYAEYVVADARYAFKIPDRYRDAEAAPRSKWALGYSKQPPRFNHRFSKNMD